MIDPAKLSEWKAKAEAATEGVWKSNDLAYYQDFDGDEDLVCARTPLIVRRKDESYESHKSRAKPDAEFIAVAREAVPALIAEVERLREALEYVSLHHAEKQCQHLEYFQPPDSTDFYFKCRCAAAYAKRAISA